MTDDEGPREIDEGFQRGFVLDDRISFARLMLELSEYRCAVTGHTFSPLQRCPIPIWRFISSGSLQKAASSRLPMPWW